MRFRFDGRVAIVWTFIAACLAVAAWFLIIEPGRSSDPVPTPTATPSPTPRATTPTPAASDTPTPTTSPEPTPDYTPTELPIGDDFTEVVQTIFNIRHDAYVLGDPTIVGQIYDSRCDCSTSAQATIRDLNERGLSYVGDAPSVSDLEVRERDRDDLAIVRVTVNFPGADLVDADGNVVDQTGGGAGRFEIALQRFTRSDDRWIAVVLGQVESR